MPNTCDKKSKILSPDDTQYAIIDLMIYLTDNPQYRLPVRYVWILSKIVQEQLNRISQK